MNAKEMLNARRRFAGALRVIQRRYLWPVGSRGAQHAGDDRTLRVFRWNFDDPKLRERLAVDLGCLFVLGVEFLKGLDRHGWPRRRRDA